ncbi:MAG: hypothetical protein JNK53_08110, partial [Phycisphaerae bacterium]|nr:hypothetical protein [Phycisphaerae bacterium]
MAAVVAMAAAWAMLCACTDAQAQSVPIELHPYELRVFLRDVDSVGVDLPRETVLASYDQYLTEWRRTAEATVTARAELVFAGSRGLGSAADVAAGLAQFRESAKRADGMEARLFERLAEHATTSAQAQAIAAARTARSAARVEVSVAHLARYFRSRTFDIDDAISRFARTRDLKVAVSAALRKSADERLTASRALQDAMTKALLLRGANADAAGLASVDLDAEFRAAREQDDAAEDKRSEDSDTSEEEDSASQRLFERIMGVYAEPNRQVWKPAVAFGRQQWNAVVECAKLLPAGQRNRLLRAASDSLIPELEQWDDHDEELIRIMGWKKAPAGCRERVVEAAHAWLEADSQALLDAAREAWIRLSTGEPASDAQQEEAGEVSRALATRRGALWQEFIDRIGPCNPPEGDPGWDEYERRQEARMQSGSESASSADEGRGDAESDETRSDFCDEPDA